MVMCFALMCMCAKPDSLLVSVHTEEGIDLDDYFGEDEENLEDDDEQDDEDEGDEDEDEDNEMSRVPPPCWSWSWPWSCCRSCCPSCPPCSKALPPKACSSGSFSTSCRC